MIYLIFGRREQGKTTLGLFMARRGYPRAIFDPRGLITTRGLTVTESADLPLAFDRLKRQAPRELVHVPSSDVEREFPAFAHEVAAWVRADRGAALRVLVDEAGFVRLDVPAFLWVLRCSRRDTVHVFITAHRPSDVPTDVRAIADHWLMFPIRQEHDLRVVAERCGTSVANRVSQLGDHECVHWDDGRSVASVFDDPSTWHISLGDEAHA